MYDCPLYWWLRWGAGLEVCWIQRRRSFDMTQAVAFCMNLKWIEQVVILKVYTERAEL